MDTFRAMLIPVRFPWSGRSSRGATDKSRSAELERGIKSEVRTYDPRGIDAACRPQPRVVKKSLQIKVPWIIGGSHLKLMPSMGASSASEWACRRVK